jgi:hypothetical protein
MQHSWDEGEMLLGEIYSQCTVCGGWRSRSRVANVDFFNGRSLHIDATGKTRKGWKYDKSTPRSCPGQAQEEPTP